MVAAIAIVTAIVKVTATDNIDYLNIAIIFSRAVYVKNLQAKLE